MKALVLEKTGPIEDKPLKLLEIPKPKPGFKQVGIKVLACGICHTDLHVIEGELPTKKLPLIPGHEVVGIVEEVGDSVSRFKIGDKVGVAWLNSTCGECYYCKRGDENLCKNAKFTGYDVDGGYAQYMISHENFTYPIPKNFTDVEAAPLLCGGVIGYRAFKLSKAKAGDILGLFGFGASAHLVIQVATYIGCEVYVFSRSEEHRKLALKLGASWVGKAGETPPKKLNSAIIFAPAGWIVPEALKVTDWGGIVVLAGIYMTPIPQLDYNLLYHERIIRSVANSTRKDVEEFLNLASKIPIKTKIQLFKMEEANKALHLLKEGQIQGAGVLKIL